MALTNAEKQARWRAKRDAETERLRNAAEAAPSSELIEARKEIERLRNEVAALKAGTPDRPRPRPFPRTAEEWAAALQAAEEERKAKRAGARLARAAARATAPAAEDETTLQEKLEQAEKQLAANKTRISTLSRRLRAREAALVEKPPMTRWLYRQIQAALHPDRVHGDDEKRMAMERCSKEFNALKFRFIDEASHE
jgi:DNA repair exonuclease SbcCD ATPase subunit